VAEKEALAALRSGLALCFFSLLFVTFFFLPEIQKSWVFGGFFLLFLCFLFFLFLSPVPKKKIQITGRQNRVDERDTIFARFDFEKGEKIHSDYYGRKPEFQSIDNGIREIPNHFTEPHFKRFPIGASLAAAETMFLRHQMTIVSSKVRPNKKESWPEKNTALIKSVLHYLGVDICGICRMEEAYLYSFIGRGPEAYGKKIDLDHKYAIVFAMEMDFGMISTAPKIPILIETYNKYVELAKISIIVSNFISRMGYPARAHMASNYQAMPTPLGWLAGLGELGRAGILITKKFGSRHRLGLVTTDLPLTIDKPVVFGVQDFCSKCLKCAQNCPASAISFGEKTETNGSVRWMLNREKCYEFWRKCGSDCATCIYVCPYSKPSNLFHNIIRGAASQSSFAQSLSIIGDDFFYGKRPKQKKSPLELT
jgi:ferredoxin